LDGRWPSFWKPERPPDHGIGTLLGVALTLLFFVALEFFDAPVIGGLLDATIVPACIDR